MPVTFLTNEDKTELQQQVKNVINNVNDEFKEKFGYEVVWQQVEFDNVVEGVVYSTSKPLGITYANGHTFEKNVVTGEEYKISTSVIPNDAYAVCMFYNGDEFVKAIEIYTDTTDYVDYDITIPDGVTLMRCVTYKAKTATLKKGVERYKATPLELKETKSDKKYYVEFNGNECFVKTKYFEGESIVFKIQKRTTVTNGLPDFTKVYVCEDSDINNNLFQKRLIFSNDSTDMISPHKVAVINNIDGDNPTSLYFTGGAHRSDNSNGGTPTAECISWVVSADGNNVSNGAVYADSVTMKWTNLIQAYNTTKNDGTGRNVIREDIRLKFENSKVFIEVTHTALEDIKRTFYYGLQAVRSSEFTSIFYSGSNSNRMSNVFDSTTGTDTNSGDKNCRDIILSSINEDKMRIHLDEMDLGNFNKSIREYSAFKRGGKCYFSIIELGESNAFEQHTGEKTMISGYYEFYK